MNTAAKLVTVLRRSGGVPPVITTSSIPDAGVGVAYSTTLAADNSPTSWSVVITDYDGTDITSGCGLSINSSGVLSGTPAIPAGSDGLWTVTVTASNAGGASAPAVYTIECWQLKVDFSTDDAAPVASPYAGEFGSLTVTDTLSRLSVSGGELVKSGTESTAWSDPRVMSGAISRAAGVAVVMDLAQDSLSQLMGGWFTSTTGGSNPEIGAYPAGSGALLVRRPGGNNIVSETNVVGTHYRYVIVLFPTGAGFYQDGVLMWHEPSGSTATLYAGINADNSNWSSSYMRIITLPPPLQTLYGAATFNVTSAFSDVRTGTANAEITGEYSIPSPDAASDELSIKFRYIDDNNHWRARIVRNAGDTNYDLLVDTLASGTPTNRLTVSNIGNTDALRIRANGNTIRFFTRSGTVWTARSSVTLSLYSAETGVTSTVVQGSWTQTRLVSVPLTDATVTAILDRVTA